MATILVSALLSQDGRVLLVRAQDGRWELPAEPLRDDESIEDALTRLLEEGLGVASGPEDFLDTYYQRGAEGEEAVIRNVFRVETWSGTLCLRSDVYSELGWIASHELATIETSETQRTILRDAEISPKMTLEPEALLSGEPITILTGPSAAGKSTIAGLLCMHAERATHIEVDLLRDMVIAGYASPHPGEGNPIRASEQVRLATANAVAVARNFSLAGYEVVVDDTIETTEALDDLLRGLAGVAPVYVFTLLPDEDTLSDRDEERSPDLQLGRRCLDLREIIATNGEQRGLRLDSSNMTRSETVAWILANREGARVL
jgi:chloramphenicol 3-O-phosphotransferase/ADP-ribose pyrophosphatase YjhB (NUDIX family)